MPERLASCAVFSSPHSGRTYPQAFLNSAVLDPLAIRSSEDAFVDRLFAAVPDHGAPLLSALLPRAYVDLNRAADELDPALIVEVTRKSANARVAAGLGVIPRVVSEGRHIRLGKISRQEAEDRLRLAYRPFHGMLRTLLDEQAGRFGTAILFDCHSMPHDALASAPLVRGRRPDVILGDRFGASCARWISDAAVTAFVEEGFVVARNAPFAGGFITQNYGRPSRGIHALQIEIDRALYMDEATLRPLPQFTDLAARLTRVVAELVRLGEGQAAVAAE
ncbi:N-formylglutamate amidohydrolase [Halovulum sp. GXIMD14793]